MPPNADAYVVIRDLRPLMREAHRVERVMAGPLARAIPALAKLGGGTGETRLRELERARELLALILAALDGAGVDPSQGVVLTLGEGQPLVLFAAEDLARLSTLARAVDIDLGERCRSLDDRPGWTVCALGELAALNSYAPAGQGEALAARLGARFPSVDLGLVNLALSSAVDDRPIDVVLRTDPQLWELTTPASFLGEEAVFASGAATALGPLAPGASFMWARLDAGLLDSLVAGTHLQPGVLTGELCLGAIDAPDGLLARAGVRMADAQHLPMDLYMKLLGDLRLTTLRELEGGGVAERELALLVRAPLWGLRRVTGLSPAVFLGLSERAEPLGIVEVELCEVDFEDPGWADLDALARVLPELRRLVCVVEEVEQPRSWRVIDSVLGARLEAFVLRGQDSD